MNEDEEFRQLQQTHWCTLGGWIPKREAIVVSGAIQHKLWYWRAENGEDLPQQGPLTFLLELSCGHTLSVNIAGKEEHELQEEWIGKPLYCVYCR